MSAPVLIVFSHLRWSFVYQRPQHLLSRLAGRWQVLFVEEPIHTEGAARLEVVQRAPNLQVLIPHTPVAAGGFHDDQLPVLAGLVDDHLQNERLDVDVAWLYTPMALPLLASVPAKVVVYDCMDELSAFKDAPRQLRQRESALLKRADVVLTGGPSLFEAKRHQHPQVHCLPSAVDAAHFAAANLKPGTEHALQAQTLQQALPRPRLGFYGVIDERLDIPLVAAVADAHPAWSIVMAGPVVKIDAAALPQRPNLHWLGMQAYEKLPYLLADWDVCLMPFALNESTRFISPTKTLEYMAGGKPVVSTPVRDVVSLYGDAVEVADGAAAFVAACERLLAEDETARRRRAVEMAAAVKRHSWDAGARRVDTLLRVALERATEQHGAAAAVQGSGLQNAVVPELRVATSGARP